MFGAGRGKGLGPLVSNTICEAVMDVRGGVEPDSGVLMVMIVPIYKISDEGPRGNQ